MTTTVTTPPTTHTEVTTSTTATLVPRARPKPAPGVTVDVVHAAESHIFSLDHTRASIDALCRAIAPFAPTWRWVRDGFDGTGSIARAIDPVPSNPSRTHRHVGANGAMARQSASMDARV